MYRTKSPPTTAWLRTLGSARGRLYSAFVATLLLASGSMGYAQPAPPQSECSITLSTDVADFGQTSRYKLTNGSTPDDTMLGLGARILQLTVSCPTPRKVGVVFHADRVSGDTYRFDDGGAFRVKLMNPILDGRQVHIGVAALGEVPQRSGKSAYMSGGDAAVPIEHGSIAQGSSLTMQVAIEATVRSGYTKTPTDRALRQTGTFELVTNP